MYCFSALSFKFAAYIFAENEAVGTVSGDYLSQKPPFGYPFRIKIQLWRS